jgi:hypothetical protein
MARPAGSVGASWKRFSGRAEFDPLRAMLVVHALPADGRSTPVGGHRSRRRGRGTRSRSEPSGGAGAGATHEALPRALGGFDMIGPATALEARAGPHLRAVPGAWPDPRRDAQRPSSVVASSSGAWREVSLPALAMKRSIQRSPNTCRAASPLWVAHSRRILLSVDVPPRATGTMWSSSRRVFDPQTPPEASGHVKYNVSPTQEGDSRWAAALPEPLLGARLQADLAAAASTRRGRCAGDVPSTPPALPQDPLRRRCSLASRSISSRTLIAS